MPIRISCVCGKQLQVPEAAAGKKVRCPACQAVLTLPAAAPAPAFEVVDRPPAPGPAKAEQPKSPVAGGAEPKKAPKPAMSLDDEPEESPPQRPAEKGAKAARDEEEDREEPRPRKAARKKTEDDDDSETEGAERGGPGRKKARKKKRPLWVVLLGLGCGGFLMLTCLGGGVLAGFFYYLGAQQDKVVGKWVVDPSAPENASLPREHRTMQFEFDDDKRCTMRLLGVDFPGKWRVVRNRENDAILVVVDFEEARGPGGRKVEKGGKEKFTAAFEITPVGADHIDLVDVKDRAARMRMKRVESLDKTAAKSDAGATEKPADGTRRAGKAGVARHDPGRLAVSPGGMKLVSGSSALTNCYAIACGVGLVITQSER